MYKVAGPGLQMFSFISFIKSVYEQMLKGAH